ncbi:MAG: beta-lactamase family protein [Ignavibacteriales bacterium]|nr:beta-lactamase family protein [Ignavibacteriales bacterium]HOJ18383.1 serine hydrolase domain-containing protein [Ignavibacteriaceae bacterium]
MKLFFSLLLLIPFSLCPQNNMIEQINSLLSKYDLPTSPGAGVYISFQGKEILKKGFGYADIENLKKVSVTTDFRLASVTKQFTATAILQLISRNKLSLDTKLSSLFPELPDYSENITISNLLNHTSGIIDYEDLIHDTVTIQVKDTDVLKLITPVDSLYFIPGTQWRYSNTAYALLSLIVEKLSGLSFPDYLEKYIFYPLGMNNTLAFVDGLNIVPERAYGYSKSETGWIKTDQSVTSAVLGDGGIYSSISDLIKWVNSLTSSKVLTPDLITLAATRKQLKDGSVINYGFGWHLKKYKGFETIYHTGSTRGFRNIIYRIPELQLVIILLTNRNEGEEKSTEALSDEITSILLQSLKK